MRNGGQTRIQRREDGSVNFHANWTIARQGYGNIFTEHWLGINIKIEKITILIL